MKKEINTFITSYEELASNYIKYFNEANEMYEENIKELGKLNNIMRKDKDFGKKVIDKLIDNDSAGTAVIISIMALEFNYRVEDAIKVLKEVSENKSYGPFSVYAKTYLMKYSKN